MKLTPIVAKHVSEVVHGNWTDIYLDEVISDITFEEAVALPPGITNSIAMLLHHISFYNDIVIERAKGNNPVINNANGFDVIVNNEAEWQQLKSASPESFKRLALFIEGLPDEKLWELTSAEKDTYYKTFHGISEHAHYHLGQIVLLKKIIRHK